MIPDLKQVNTQFLPFFYVGPDLDKTRVLPSIFYWTLSAEDSLLIDPFNQPLSLFDLTEMRVFSCTLPEHEKPKSPHRAIGTWTERLNAHDPFLVDFLEKVKGGILELIDKGYLNPNSLGLMGLSRGSFICLHVAAKLPLPCCVVAFAPLTSLTATEEGISQNYTDSSLDLNQILPQLTEKTLSFYIGNQDTRVDTQRSIQLYTEIVQTGHKEGRRPLNYHLHVYPSIGYKGHGTPPEIFKEGALFIKNQINKTG